MSHPAGQVTRRPPSPTPSQGSSVSTVGGLIALVFVVAMVLSLMRSGSEHMLTTVAILFLCTVGVPWITGPLRLKASQWIGLDVHFDPFDPESEEVPPGARDAILGLVPRLEAVGFHTLGHYRLERSAPNITAFVTLLENRQGRQTARILTTVVQNSPNPVYMGGVPTLIFLTNFGDGSRLVTSNNLLQRLQPSLSRMRRGSMSFPWIRDPFRLYAIHEACVAFHAPDGIRVAPSLSDPVAHLKETRDEELAHFVETGYFYVDESLGQYRLTWKGAMLSGWKLLWPLKPIRQSLRHRAARRILREVEMNQPASSA